MQQISNHFVLALKAFTLRIPIV